jgi:hypothetical protein
LSPAGKCDYGRAGATYLERERRNTKALDHALDHAAVSSLRLDGGDGDNIADVFGFATAR